jgi:hypothetical protein
MESFVACKDLRSYHTRSRHVTSGEAGSASGCPEDSINLLKYLQGAQGMQSRYWYYNSGRIKVSIRVKVHLCEHGLSFRNGSAFHYFATVDYSEMNDSLFDQQSS